MIQAPLKDERERFEKRLEGRRRESRELKRAGPRRDEYEHRL
jgi:hypothetical protein